jgi:TRAP-type C4-dicarboxylate transport system permease large subunit
MNRRPGEWLSSLPLFILLTLTLIISSGEMLHGQMLRLGEQFFGDPSAGVQYFLLRADPTAPDCDPNVNVDAAVEKLAAPSADDSGIGDLFGDVKVDKDALRKSVLQSVQLCKDKITMYHNIVSHITPELKAYRTVETTFFAIFHYGMDNRSLLLLAIVFFAGITTTIQRHHIALRPAHTVMDYRIQALAMTLGNGMVLASVLSHLHMAMGSGIAVEKPEIFYLWIALFGILTLISLVQIFSIPKTAKAGGNPLSALLAVPLYSFMALNAGAFFLGRSHWSGLSIYVNQMLEYSGLFLNLALYIWIGMLLKQTRFLDMFLDVLRPWKMSPEALTYFILLGTALPTAYTGASAIFVIAGGSLIYHEVKRAGGNPQFALAASAMSGSLGGVLKPCLLVVFIAALNKQVTTSELFHWGFYVFLVTSTLFFLVSQFYRTSKVKIAPIPVAIAGMGRSIVPLTPYIVLVILVVLAYQYILNTKLDEFTAAVIVPVVMLVLVVFDQWKRKRELKTGREMENWLSSTVIVSLLGVLALDIYKLLQQNTDSLKEGATPMTSGDWIGSAAPMLMILVMVWVVFADFRRRKQNRPAPKLDYPDDEAPVGLEKAMRFSTNETIAHIGALIMLMTLSQAMGGVVERSGIMEYAPTHFPNIWVAMTFLMVSKVLLGMIMDPMGAMILVSGTLAPIAYNAGINPVHFWMMVLVAFELGYLLPPVAINQLMLRQVVGEVEIDRVTAEVQNAPFMRRMERWILPLIVMSIGLLLVTYTPLIYSELVQIGPIHSLLNAIGIDGTPLYFGPGQ